MIALPDDIVKQACKRANEFDDLDYLRVTCLLFLNIKIVENFIDPDGLEIKIRKLRILSSCETNE